MVFNSPCLTDKKELIHHEVEMVINSPWIMPLLGTKGLASPEQTATVGLFNKATKTANYMVLEGVLMKNKDAASSRDIQLICAEFSSIQVKTQADWMLLQSSYFNPQVPTGRVVVPTGRYVVPAGKVIIIVSPGRLSLVPTGRVLSPGKRFQLLDPANLYNDMRWNVTRPQGFEVVMRIRCSQPKKNLDRPFKDGEIEKAGKGIPFLKLVMKLQAQKETDDIRLKKFSGMKN
ncbi:hypothetical protein Tco_0622519 [Tanacetum coccineum]